MHFNILFEMGIILFLGFFTAMLMKQLRQSVIAGYMVTGLLIGPNVLGWVRDTGSINTLSELGIVLLMFFLGLEFSIAKFQKVKNSVLFIGTSKILFNLVVGIVLGSLFGLLMKERLYLACIIALSSSGVVAKLLFDLKRTAAKESEVLMGVMVYEDFIAIILLGVLSSLAAMTSIPVHAVAGSIIKSFAFYAVFIVLGIFLANKFIDKVLMRIESQELFTALMMGMILLIGALAVKIGLASAAGAFLFGMLINSYDVEERLHRTVSAFKDIFLIVFFTSFGMLLDPEKIPNVLWLIAIVVPLSILAETFSTSSAAFFSGFSPKKAVNIGTSTLARGEYSLIYATLGFSTGAISKDLYQFTGVYVFLMTLFAPIAMRNASAVNTVLSRVVPRFLKYSAKLVSVTMRPILLPEETNVVFERRFTFILSFLLYLIVTVWAFTETNIIILTILCILGLSLVYLLRTAFIAMIKKIESQINYKDLHEGPYNLEIIARTIANIFSGFLAIIILGASFWNFGPAVLIGLIIVFTVYLLAISLYAYKKAENAGK